jgi:hypothetical protein
LSKNPASAATRVVVARTVMLSFRHSFSLEIITSERPSTFVNLGPHPPRLWPEDIDLAHELWLEMSEKYTEAKLHHRDVVGVALRRMREQLQSTDRQAVIRDVRREIERRNEPAPMS